MKEKGHVWGGVSLGDDLPDGVSATELDAALHRLDRHGVWRQTFAESGAVRLTD